MKAYNDNEVFQIVKLKCGAAAGCLWFLSGLQALQVTIYNMFLTEEIFT